MTRAHHQALQETLEDRGRDGAIMQHEAELALGADMLKACSARSVGLSPSPLASVSQGSNWACVVIRTDERPSAKNIISSFSQAYFLMAVNSSVSHLSTISGSCYHAR